MWKRLDYLWERRRVVGTVAANLTRWALHEFGRQRARTDLPTIICVRRTARSRIHNHAISLGPLGVQSILVAQAFDYGYQRAAFAEIHPWFRVDDIPAIVRKLVRRHDVRAVVGSLQPAAQTERLLAMDLPVPLVIDHHDSAWSQVHFQGNAAFTADGWLSRAEVAAEQHCFRNVAGVIARSHELVELFETNDVTTPTRVFEDCCCAEAFQPIPEHGRPKGDAWSVGYAGAVFSLRDDPRHAYPQFVPFGKTFEQARVHLHIYPSPLHEYSYPDYLAEERRNPFFHLHRSVGFRHVQSTLARYDFGLINVEVSGEYRLFSPVHFKHHVHAKFHTYLEAGLPILVPAYYRREAELVREWDMGIVFESLHGLDLAKLIADTDVARLRANVRRAREAFRAEAQGSALWDFLGSIRTAHTNP